MEQYEHFCAISKHLYSEVELAAAMVSTLSRHGVDTEYWEQRKSLLLQNIEIHLQDFDQVIFEKELATKI